MRLDRRRLCVAIALLGVNLPLYALDLGSDTFSISGFGTVGLVHSDYSDGDFRTDGAVPRGAGRSHDWSFSQMSKVGVQVDAKLSSKWSSSIQAVSEYTYEGDYTPVITNAFLKYEATPNVALRAGRMVQPIYMLTDFSRVGYAIPWARPPIEMYNNYPTYDGMDAVYKFNVWGVALTAQGFAGHSTYKTASAPGSPVTTIESDETLGANLVADIGALTLRVAHNQSKGDFHNSSFDQIFALYRSLGLNALADQYQPSGKVASYDTVGVSYDPGSWFMRAEMAKVSWNSTTVLPSSTSGYLTGGYRTGDFTPYAIYAWNEQDSPTSIGSADPLGAINATMAGADSSRHSMSVGVRWDFKQNMDFKLQLTRVEKDSATSSNGLINRVSGSTVPESYNVIFAGIDFVF